MNPDDAIGSVRQRIAEAAQRSGRSADDVRLIAISKRQPVAAIESLIAHGQRDFGENQMQEAIDKILHLQDLPVEWHFIGHLQSNKTRHVGSNFNWVHTVDSAKLARRIAASADEAGQPVKLLLQVNVASDPAKHGIEQHDLFPLIDTLLEEQLKNVRLRGLMTIGQRSANETETRATFAGLRVLLEQCRQRFGDSFCELSMGMSGDLELAVEEGATMVRVGEALFGHRA
ncbi:MAG: YggS family pyridoxal phosphate-dependent enzyme [Gammaproteobacteria bacterium]|nr:MAG: YggS family pyridoxal phosphate-dependent enzyme [Gammaproteobacteria bacterium]